MPTWLESSVERLHTSFIFKNVRGNVLGAAWKRSALNSTSVQYSCSHNDSVDAY